MQAMELSLGVRCPRILTQRPSLYLPSAESLSTILLLQALIGSSGALSSALHLGALPGPSWPSMLSGVPLNP